MNSRSRHPTGGSRSGLNGTTFAYQEDGDQFMIGYSDVSDLVLCQQCSAQSDKTVVMLRTAASKDVVVKGLSDI